MALSLGAVFAPSLSVWFKPVGAVWNQALNHLLGQSLVNTAILVVGSAALSALVGLSLAFVTTVYALPMKRLISTLLVLPLALPPFVVVLVWSQVTSTTGWLYTTLIGLGVSVDPRWTVIDPKGMAIWVYTWSLYPYVYLVSRSLLAKHLGPFIENARLLGHGLWKIYWTLIVPLSLPALLGGGLLVGLEVLSDYGVIAYLGIPTFAVSIVRTWIRLGDFDAALRLALMALIFTGIVLGIQAMLMRSIRHLMPAKPKALVPIALHGPARIGVGFLLGGSLVMSLGVPLIQLIGWAVQSGSRTRWNVLMKATLSTLTLSLGVSLLIVVIAIVLGYSQRLMPKGIGSWGAKSALLGYAVPGSVIGILTLALLWPLRTPLALSTTWTLLGVALVMRYTGLAVQSVTQGFAKLGKALGEAASVLGHSPLSVLWRIELPLIKPALVAGFSMVFLDVVKELPLTLLLRPFNTETLATRIHQYAADEQIVLAAVPSLIVIGVSFGVIVLMMRSRKPEVR
jgi:iron(III) transport system permease protein